MNHRRQRAWLVFLAAATAAFAALALLTWNARQATLRHNVATVEAQRQEDLRTALYRMEQRIAPMLARVLGRTEVPALVSDSLALRLDVKAGRALPLEELLAPPAELVERALVELAADAGQEAAFEHTDWLIANGTLGSNFDQVDARGSSRSNYEQVQRQNLYAQQNVASAWGAPGNPDAQVVTGPLIAGWDSGPEQAANQEQQVVLVRGIALEGAQLVQSLWISWRELEALLLAEVDDLFENATLVPVSSELAAQAGLGGALEGDLEGDLLATIPARLVVPPARDVAGEDRAFFTTTLATWVLALFAFAAATLAFRASQRDAARQRRFTSAVTHELRTPLTTFRMYSEMLARDMVPPERRSEYLRALEDESRRLGALVENVLAHARLEDGHAHTRREALSVQALIERAEAPLRRRCEEAGTGLELELGTAADTRVNTDPEAIGLVLSNLVDNACKYGAPAEGHSLETPIRLTAAADAHGLTLTLRDRGPGVPRAAAETIFRPFERAGRDESDAAPGVGLGLALARDLARALGGELSLLQEETTGAAFALRLPLA